MAGKTEDSITHWLFWLALALGFIYIVALLSPRDASGRWIVPN
jgi:hypothetical protein